MFYRMSARLLLGALLLIVPALRAAAGQRADFGTLSIQVRPPDAAVFIDGERWVSPEAAGPLQIQLSPGRHRLELRAPGHRPYSADVEIRAGETTPLNVALPEGEPRIVRSAAPPVGFAAADDEDGFVVAPDFRVSEIGHETGTLAGAYAGYVFGGRVLVGGGAYWQTNRSEGGRIAYGGPVLEWRAFKTRAIGFNLHALVGGGQWYADDVFVHPDLVDRRFMSDRRFSTIRFGRVHEDFFVAEPEAEVVIRFGAHVRLQAGAGYRATSMDNLSGASGSISLQVGK